MCDTQDIEANSSPNQGYSVRDMTMPELQIWPRGGKHQIAERGASKKRRSLKIHIPPNLGDSRLQSSPGVSVMSSSAQDSDGVVLHFLCVWHGQALVSLLPASNPF